MTLELEITLAEALIERKALKERLENLEERVTASARVQEGDTPAEDPAELMAQFDAAASEMEQLIVAINRTNLATPLAGQEGWSLMEAIARRDMLTLRQEAISEIIDASRTTRAHWAVTRSEVRTVATVDVAALQRQMDALAKERRELDARLQAANWTTKLMA